MGKKNKNICSGSQCRIETLQHFKSSTSRDIFFDKVKLISENVNLVI